MFRRLRHAAWMRRARRLGYVRVAGLEARNGILVEAGQYQALTRSNIDEGHLIVDALGDLWARREYPKAYRRAPYSSRVGDALLRKVKRLTPNGISPSLTVSFGDDPRLDYFCSFTFEDAQLSERSVNPYCLPQLPA